LGRVCYCISSRIGGGEANPIMHLKKVSFKALSHCRLEEELECSSASPENAFLYSQL